jgi:hypothetical protein
MVRASPASVLHLPLAPPAAAPEPAFTDSWVRMGRLVRRGIPPARIQHPWPHLRVSMSASKAGARCVSRARWICAGGRPVRQFLPRPQILRLPPLRPGAAPRILLRYCPRTERGESQAGPLRGRRGYYYEACPPTLAPPSTIASRRSTRTPRPPGPSCAPQRAGSACASSSTCARPAAAPTTSGRAWSASSRRHSAATSTRSSSGSSIASDGARSTCSATSASSRRPGCASWRSPRASTSGASGIRAETYASAYPLASEPYSPWWRRADATVFQADRADEHLIAATAVRALGAPVHRFRRSCRRRCRPGPPEAAAWPSSAGANHHW